MLMPGVMKVDYVRVYQRTAGLSPDGLSCSPPDYPTAEYIANHAEAYANPNLTTWSKQGPVGGAAGYPWPKNSAVSSTFFCEGVDRCSRSRSTMVGVDGLIFRLGRGWNIIWDSCRCSLLSYRYTIILYLLVTYMDYMCSLRNERVWIFLYFH
jgi:hypothetical protein